MATAKKATAPEQLEGETPPEPEPDEGTVCAVCGRRGRAEGHH